MSYKNIENYETCPNDCPLNQSDGICIIEDEGVCDPDCSFDADVNCALDLVNITNMTKNITSLVFELEIKNFANISINNINWTFDTGESKINSTQNFNLSSQEDLFFYIQHNYPTGGNYLVNATIQSGLLIDSEILNITI